MDKDSKAQAEMAVFVAGHLDEVAEYQFDPVAGHIFWLVDERVVTVNQGEVVETTWDRFDQRYPHIYEAYKASYG